ncbi:MFS transporter, DHA1 family, multidrug resistance protein [Ligilactobacillus sp. WC1T17]|uniref:MFS transporter, DHA1 family, multidrug resistance protein n=2 Tax=Ligilactobacillus TaxID=2767887 RepID=A0ABY1ADI3_9LACO|nr:MFS transporter, DHA1 family, multidrug resistance protein [Ligilactobacillus ruminis]
MQKELWQRNLAVLWFGVFMVGMALSEVMPFLSLYINELGNYNKQELNFYSGLVYALSFLTMAIVSPLWGKLADKKGRRLMLLRASFGMATVFFLMGFVQNVWELALLRALQGAFGGYVSNSNALIAAQTPKAKSGQALSILVTGITAGNLLGPFLGGTLASVFSYRLTFHITGIILFLVFCFTLIFVKEDKSAYSNPQKRGKSLTFKEVAANQVIFFLIVTTLLVNSVNMAINPILSLYVKELLGGHGSVTFIAGIIAAMPGFSTVVVAPLFGRLGDKIGTQKVLLFGFLFAIAVFLLTALAQNVVQLGIMRFLTGISNAALLPEVQTLLTKHSSKENTSIVFAYNQSFQSIGALMGPVCGTLIAGFFDYRGIFIFCSLVMVVNALRFFKLRSVLN